MGKNKYKIKFLPSFSEELNEIVYYITFILKNKTAAENLIQKVYNEIEKRRFNPESFELYKSNFSKYSWYRIYVNNFVIFYTVTNNTMKVAHIIYNARNLDNLL